MQPPETEILSQIRKVQAELNPALPAEIRMETPDIPAVLIRVELLRARLDLPPEHEHTPMPLIQLLALLTELIGHTEDLGRDTSAGQPNADPVFRSAAPAPEVILQAMRDTILTGEIAALRTMLGRQRQALAATTLSPTLPVSSSEGPEI